MYNSTRLTHERFPCQKLHNNDVGATLLLGKDDYQLYDHKTYEKKSFYDGILKKRHELGDKAIAGFSLNNFYVAFLRDEYTLEVGSVPRKTLIECLFISEERRLNPNS